MTDAERRKEVMDMYPNGINWHRRVSRMPDNQIFAIWSSKQLRDERVRIAQERAKVDVNDNEAMHAVMRPVKEEYHQIDIWEYLIEKDAYEQAEGAY